MERRAAHLSVAEGLGGGRGLQQVLWGLAGWDGTCWRLPPARAEALHPPGPGPLLARDPQWPVAVLMWVAQEGWSPPPPASSGDMSRMTAQGGVPSCAWLHTKNSGA